MKCLLINGCTRTNSRTNELVKEFISSYKGDINVIDLKELNLKVFDEEILNKRTAAIAKGDLNNPCLDIPNEFKDAELLVFATPHYNLTLDALLHNYLEYAIIVDLTFGYNSDGSIKSFTNTKKIIYLTSCGGTSPIDYGFEYVKAIAKVFLNTEDVVKFSANDLDVIGNDVNKILEEEKNKIREYLK